MQLPRLREWRERRALTQRELGARAGLRQATVWQLEAGGEARPTTVRKLARALRVPIADLLSTDAPATPPADTSA